MQLLLGATLIDGTGAAPVPDAAVLIDDGRITAAGPRRAVSWPADAEVIDLSGLTLLPGLIDCHDHLAAHGYGLPQRWGLQEPLSTVHMRTAAVLRQLDRRVGGLEPRELVEEAYPRWAAPVPSLLSQAELALSGPSLMTPGALEGFRLAAEASPAAIVLDVRLPDASGIDLGLHPIA